MLLSLSKSLQSDTIHLSLSLLQPCDSPGDLSSWFLPLMKRAHRPVSSPEAADFLSSSTSWSVATSQTATVLFFHLYVWDKEESLGLILGQISAFHPWICFAKPLQDFSSSLSYSTPVDLWECSRRPHLPVMQGILQDI